MTGLAMRVIGAGCRNRDTAIRLSYYTRAMKNLRRTPGGFQMKKAFIAAALLMQIFAVGASDYIPDARLSVGTQGVGLEIAQPLIPRYLTLSAQGNYFSYTDNFNEDGTEYDGRARLLTIGVLLNLHPFANGFRFTGGVYDNQNYLHANNTQPVKQDGITVASNIDVDATFKHFAPYTGVGWVWGHRITASLDAGVMFQGKAKTSFMVDCTAQALCQPTVNQEEQDVQREADKYRFYPVVRFAVGF